MHGCDEPYESRDSRTDLWAAGGEIPLADPALEEESRMAAGRLRPGQSLPTPQAAYPAIGSSVGVVSPEAGKRPSEAPSEPAKAAFIPNSSAHSMEFRRGNALILAWLKI